VLPILSNYGFLYVLWVSYDITQGNLCDLLENWGVKRLEVPLQRISSTPASLFISFYANGRLTDEDGQRGLQESGICRNNETIPLADLD